MRIESFGLRLRLASTTDTLIVKVSETEQTNLALVLAEGLCTGKRGHGSLVFGLLPHEYVRTVR